MSKLMRKPRILILGADFNNQGAFLMLISAAEQIRQRFGGVPVIEIQLGTQRTRIELGLDALMSVQKLHFHPRGGRRKSFRRVKDHLPFIFASEIDAVFDVSGFAFGDQWKHANLRRRANHLRWWSERVPVYMLPQALGPFEHTGGPARTALAAAELVFARDPDSFQYASELTGAARNLRKSPDFTVLTKGTELPAKYNEHAGGIAIVPNWNILTRAGTPSKESAYIDNLASVAKHGQSNGFHVFGLCHEGERDRKILEAVSQQVVGMPIVSGLNGLESKALLGAATYVVAGRFHALVSALSQGVPSIIHGWSHKYRWLAADFDIDDLIRDPYLNTGFADDLTFLESNETRLREQIVKASTRLADLSEEMWAEIEGNLRVRLAATDCSSNTSLDRA